MSQRRRSRPRECDWPPHPLEPTKSVPAPTSPADHGGCHMRCAGAAKRTGSRHQGGTGGQNIIDQQHGAAGQHPTSGMKRAADDLRAQAVRRTRLRARVAHAAEHTRTVRSVQVFGDGARQQSALIEPAMQEATPREGDRHHDLPGDIACADHVGQPQGEGTRGAQSARKLQRTDQGKRGSPVVPCRNDDVDRATRSRGTPGSIEGVSNRQRTRAARTPPGDVKGADAAGAHLTSEHRLTGGGHARRAQAAVGIGPRRGKARGAPRRQQQIEGREPGRDHTRKHASREKVVTRPGCGTKRLSAVRARSPAPAPDHPRRARRPARTTPGPRSRRPPARAPTARRAWYDRASGDGSGAGTMIRGAQRTMPSHTSLFCVPSEWSTCATLICCCRRRWACSSTRSSKRPRSLAPERRAGFVHSRLRFPRRSSSSRGRSRDSWCDRCRAKRPPP